MSALGSTIPAEGGLLFVREDGQAGCPRCGTVYATTNPERPTECPICEYDGIADAAVLDAAKVVAMKDFTRRRVGPKVGRNDPCPCGSGRKAKKCCGAS